MEFISDKYLDSYFENSLKMSSNVTQKLDKDEILSRVNITELIGRYIEVSSFNKAKCPFHDDSNASFSIHPTRQFFKCFGCGVSGNAVDFIMHYRKVDFLEALEILKKEC
jgi:DNA primase